MTFHFPIVFQKLQPDLILPFFVSQTVCKCQKIYRLFCGVSLVKKKRKMWQFNFRLFRRLFLHKEMTTIFLLEKYRIFFILFLKLSLKCRSFLEKILQWFMVSFCMIFILLTMTKELSIHCYLTHRRRNLTVLLPLFLHIRLPHTNLTPTYLSWSSTQSKLLLLLIISV